MTINMFFGEEYKKQLPEAGLTLYEIIQQIFIQTIEYRL